MHVHVFNYGSDPSGQPPKEYWFPLFIANGVTSVRLMWVRLPQVPQVQLWRKRSAEQQGSVPRIAAIGTVVNGPPPATAAGQSAGVGPRYADKVTTADEARRMVDQLKAGGVDFVKVYSLLSREAYFAIADEARKQRIPFAGHVPFAVSPLEASEAGQRSIEHLTEIGLACSSQEQELRKVAPQDWGPKQVKQMLETYDEAKCARLFSRFKGNGTWQVPTLALFQRSVSRILGESLLASDDRLKYIPPKHREQWSKVRPPPESLSAEQKDDQLKQWQMRLNLVGGLHRADVGIMAGTDVGNPGLYPGFSLHDELVALVKAELTPMAALQAATLNPARFLGMEKDLGTVQKGKIADLVLLEANPLEDISNTRKINAVVVSGRLLDRKSLDGLLAQAEAAANNWQRQK
jgi:imidazolonepropionase-like amidohydrolase